MNQGRRRGATDLLFLCGALMVTAFIAPTAIPAERGITVFRGAPQNGSAVDTISYNNPGDETFNEGWQLTAQLRNGALLSIFFAVYNVGPGDGHGGILLRYLPRTGMSITRIIDSVEAKSATGTSGVQFGQSALALSGQFVDISIRGPQVSFVGRIRPLAPPYSPGDGRISDAASGKYLAWDVIVPRGYLRGELNAGNIHQRVEGYAYLDHSDATLLASDFSRTWRSLRLHTQEWTLDFLSIGGLRGGTRSRFIAAQLIDAGGSIRASTDCVPSGKWLHFGPSREAPSAQWGFACRFQDGSLDAQIVPIRVVAQSRPFDVLPPLARFVMRLLSVEPYDYVILHSYVVRLSLSAKKTVLRGSGYDEFVEFRR